MKPYKKYSKNYIKSSWWKKRRKQKLEKENYICQRCGGEASMVHHNDFSMLYNEPDNHLEALCRDCHDIQFEDKIQASTDLRWFKRALKGQL